VEMAEMQKWGQEMEEMGSATIYARMS